MNVVRYSNEYEELWDDFVMNLSCNGTFLQTRRFLNYHENGKFVDASYLLFDDKKKLTAVFSACEKNIDSEKMLVSHAGSTYGGILFHRDKYKTLKVLDIIDSFEERWKIDGYKNVNIRQTPTLFSQEAADLVYYCYYLRGYSMATELNLFVDFSNYNDNMLREISQGKRTNITNCIKEGLIYKKLSSFTEICQMHELLCMTLDKYNKSPVHSVEEIFDFLNYRLENECECFGVYKNDEMIASSMMFYFENVKVAHAQYLCANPIYNTLSPMTYLYYIMMLEMRKKGYKKLSWGIVTEQDGLYLNEGLVKSKEAYGSNHSLNYKFSKRLR